MRQLVLVWVMVVVFIHENEVLSQDQFKFKDEDQRAEKINYKSVNNLIILSATLNGKPINFLLDTGVNKTKVFGELRDSTLLENSEFIKLRSLGSAEPVKAYKSTNNTIDFGPVYGADQEVYFITDPRFDLASKLGVNVQGIIGYELFKDFIVRLNYTKNSLKLYQHPKFNRKLRNFDQIDFRLIRKKPNIKLPITLLNETEKELVFLVDTGSSDAFWLFEDKHIYAPDNSFLDYVGYGLEMAVEGKRSKAQAADFGKYTLKTPRVAYIDSNLSKLFRADLYKDGIVGSEILRRFILFFDYKNLKIHLRPSFLFNTNSNYDRSGLLLVFAGEEIKTIRTPVLVRVNEDSNYSPTNAEKFEIRYERSQILQVAEIRKNSPASKIDIKKGDRILRLNGTPVDRMNFEQINDLLSSKENKKIRIKLQRQNLILKREIYLRSRLK